MIEYGKKQSEHEKKNHNSITIAQVCHLPRVTMPGSRDNNQIINLYLYQMRLLPLLRTLTGQCANFFHFGR